MATKIAGEIQFPKITSHITKHKVTGVDEVSTLLLNYENIRLQCIISTSIVVDTPSTVKIYGENGSIHVNGGVYCPKSIEVHFQGNAEYIELSVEGNGLIYQADHVRELIKKDIKESPLLTWEETSLNMKIIDTARFQNDFLFPGEKK